MPRCEGAVGAVRYGIASQPDGAGFRIDEYTGVLMASGVDPDTYAVDVTVMAEGDENHAAGTIVVNLTVKIAKMTPTIFCSDAAVAMGKTASLGATVTAGAGKLSYRSSDESVVRVSSSGKLTPVGVGTATVTITAAANGDWKKATAAVTVTVTEK